MTVNETQSVKLHALSGDFAKPMPGVGATNRLPKGCSQ
jgi:hypothetical protein